MTKLLIIFIALNILNVTLCTIEKICAVKCGKVVSALVSALTFGVYTIVLVYMSCDLNLFLKAGIVAGCNLIGVFTVKAVQEKIKKDKTWKIEITVNNSLKRIKMEYALQGAGLPFNTIESRTSSHAIINVFCYTQKDSEKIKEILANFNHKKYFVTETKSL